MGREHHAGIVRQQKQTAATRDRARPPVQRVEAPGPAMGALASPGAILALQRTIGNAAVNQLLRQHALTAAPFRRTAAPAPSGLAVQRHAEDEETVQTMPSSPGMSPVQRHAEGEDEAVQTLPAAQRLHAADAPANGADLGARIRAAAGGGSALDGGVRRTLEARLGASLSGVRVHTSGEADRLSRSVQALAFTTGSDIFFRSGAYNPATPGGLRLLAHEATHTVQQARGPVAGTPHPGGVSISDPADSFERAAEASAARVIAAPNAPVQRHAEDEGRHICTASCQHAMQRAAEGSLTATTAVASARETHVCGPHCHHAARPGAVAMRTAAYAPGKPRIPVRRTTGQPLAVQRHSSFEHKMLGDVSPDDLKVLASAANLNKQGRAVEKYAGGGEKDIRGPNGQVITRENVVHILEQEIRRLNYFKSAAVQPNGAPMSGQQYQAHLRNQDKRDRLENRLDEEGISSAQARALIATPQGAQLRQDLKAIVDTEWQVRIVSLSSRDGSAPLLITYGEMNTLADLYGSPKEILEAEPRNRYQLVQGIRQQSIIKFLDLLREVKGTNYLTKKFGMHLGEGFDDAIGSTGRGDGPLPLGELRLMGTIPGAKGKKTGDADASQSYKGGLSRNACHFAPESWHAWADYHSKARLLAAHAYGLRNPGGGGRRPRRIWRMPTLRRTAPCSTTASVTTSCRTLTRPPTSSTRRRSCSGSSSGSTLIPSRATRNPPPSGAGYSRWPTTSRAWGSRPTVTIAPRSAPSGPKTPSRSRT